MPKYVFQGSLYAAEWALLYKQVVGPLRRIATGSFRIHLRLELAGVRSTKPLATIQEHASNLGLRMAISVVDDYRQPVQVYDSPSGKGMCAMCTEDVGPCEGYPCVNAQPKFVPYRGS